jgi:hypothetical protein
MPAAPLGLRQRGVRQPTSVLHALATQTFIMSRAQTDI